MAHTLFLSNLRNFNPPQNFQLYGIKNTNGITCTRKIFCAIVQVKILEKVSLKLLLFYEVSNGRQQRIERSYNQVLVYTDTTTQCNATRLGDSVSYEYTYKGAHL